MRFESQLSRMYCQNIFNRIELGAFRRQGENGDVGGNEQSYADRCHPAGPIDGERRRGLLVRPPWRTSARCRFIASSIAEGQDQSRALAPVSGRWHREI